MHRISCTYKGKQWSQIDPYQHQRQRTENLTIGQHQKLQHLKVHMLQIVKKSVCINLMCVSVILSTPLNGTLKRKT